MREDAVYCVCDAWKEYVKILDSIIFLAYLHGQEYPNNGQFIYCPWCGHSLLEKEKETKNYLTNENTLDNKS